MIIFETTIGEMICKKDSLSFYKKINENYERELKRRPNPGESVSWSNSLPALITVFEELRLDTNINVLIEYDIPVSRRRIDVVLCGKDSKANDSAVIIELKQWEKIDSSTIKRMVKTDQNDRREAEHPSSQVLTYKDDLYNLDRLSFEKIELNPAVYLHNHMSIEAKGVLAPIYKYLIDLAPVFDKRTTDKFKEFLVRRLSGGASEYVYRAFKDMKYNPSKSLIDNAKQFNNEIDKLFENISLFGDQISAFNIIKDNINFSNKEITSENTNSQIKNIFIVEGAAGTGKTIVAFKIYLNFLEKYKMGLVLPGTDFRGSVKKLFSIDSKENAKRLFGGRLRGQPTKPTTFEKGEFQFIVVDEAHKLTKKASRSAVIPFEDLISKTNNIMFLYDKDQVVHIDSYGEMKRIVDKYSERAEYNIIYINLENQFRSNGGLNYFDWIDSTLYNRGGVIALNKGENFTFKIATSEQELLNSHNEAIDNKKRSRLLSTGTSFDWTREVIGGELVKDVKIANNKFAWYLPNSKSIRDKVKNFKNATKKELEAFTFDFNLDDNKANKFIGYHNTVQGSEFQHTSIYVGDEFLIRDGRVDVDESKFSKSSSRWFKSLNGKLSNSEKKEIHEINREIALNQLKVLMTRSRDSIVIYFKNDELRQYFVDLTNNS